MNKTLQLIHEIEHAFDGVSRPEVMLHPDCNDGSEISVFRAYSRWEDIDAEDIASEPSALCFVSAEGFQFLIPAYMRHALRHMAEGSFSGDAAIYALCPSNEREIFQQSKYEKLTPEQRLAIRHFLELMAASPDAADSRAASKGLETFWTHAGPACGEGAEISKSTT